MNKIFYSILAVGFFYLISCNPQPEAKVLLRQAESIVKTHPDSVLLLIDSIFYPEKSFKQEDYMRFLVIQVQAKYETYHPIIEDTLIFQASDFFSKNNKNPRITALAYFYSGCVYRERGKYNEAMLHYSKAGDYAMQTSDFALQGLVRYNMGDLFAKQGFYKEALSFYTEALKLNVSEPGKQAQCLSAVGRMYTILQQPDSAFCYFHKGLKIAEIANDTEILDLLTQNLSVAYTNTKKFDMAERYLRQSFSLNTDSTEIPRYYLNFSKLYVSMGRLDSAAIYSEKLKKSIDTAKDNNFKASVYSYLAGWEKTRANYEAAFAYQGKRMETLSRIMEERNNQLVYEAHRKYDYEKMQKQYYMDIANKQILIFVLLVVVIGGGTFTIWYWIGQRDRQMEAQRNLDTLQEMKRELENKISQIQLELRKKLLWRLSLNREVLLLNSELKKPNRIKFDEVRVIGHFNKIVFGKKDSNQLWDSFLEAINEIRPGIKEKIMENYPSITEQEYRISILVYAGFDLNESALALNLSPYTIQARRSDIRKKMGLNTRSDIAAHIDQLYG